MDMMFNMLKTPIQKAILKILPEILPILEEVGLFADNDVKRNDVIDFVRGCKHLKKLHLVHSNNELTQNFDYDIDDRFDVSVIWDAFAQEGSTRGSITFELKYDNWIDENEILYLALRL